MHGTLQINETEQTKQKYIQGVPQNLEWTGVKENVRIFNPMGSESHINFKKQVGRVLRDTL